MHHVLAFGHLPTSQSPGKAVICRMCAPVPHAGTVGPLPDKRYFIPGVVRSAVKSKSLPGYEIVVEITDLPRDVPRFFGSWTLEALL